jgi:hypothetical protein
VLARALRIVIEQGGLPERVGEAGAGLRVRGVDGEAGERGGAAAGSSLVAVRGAERRRPPQRGHRIVQRLACAPAAQDQLAAVAGDVDFVFELVHPALTERVPHLHPLALVARGVGPALGQQQPRASDLAARRADQAHVLLGAHAGPDRRLLRREDDPVELERAVPFARVHEDEREADEAHLRAGAHAAGLAEVVAGLIGVPRGAVVGRVLEHVRDALVGVGRRRLEIVTERQLERRAGGAERLVDLAELGAHRTLEAQDAGAQVAAPRQLDLLVRVLDELERGRQMAR